MTNTKTWKTLDWSLATVDDVKQIIANGADINEEVSSGSGKWREEFWVVRSPLAFATEAKNKKVVAFLLENGANPNYVARNTQHYWGEVDITYLPSLTLAIRTGDRGIVDLYFKHGVDPFNVGEDVKGRGSTDEGSKLYLQREYEAKLIKGNHPLTVAIEQGDKALVTKIIREYEIPEYQKKRMRSVFGVRSKREAESDKAAKAQELYKFCVSYFDNPTEACKDLPKKTQREEVTVPQQGNTERVSAVKRFLGRLMIWGDSAKRWLAEAKTEAQNTAVRKALESKQKGPNE